MYTVQRNESIHRRGAVATSQEYIGQMLELLEIISILIPKIATFLATVSYVSLFGFTVSG